MTIPKLEPYIRFTPDMFRVPKPFGRNGRYSPPKGTFTIAASPLRRGDFTCGTELGKTMSENE